MPGNEGVRYCASYCRERKRGAILALLNQGLFVVVQWPSHVQLFATPWTSAHLSFTTSHSLLKLLSVELMMPSNHLILCHSLLLLPSIFPSIRVFSSESALHIRVAKYWSFIHSPFNEYSRLISFRIDCFGLIEVQATPKDKQWFYF